MVSNQPFASSPRSLNGTGYGTLNGKNLKENAALSKRKRIRFPSLIDASACAGTKESKHKREHASLMTRIKEDKPICAVNIYINENF